MTRDERLAQLAREHRDAVEFFMTRARAVTDAQWHTPRAEGKWTPAQEARHLVLSYQAFIGDLRDEKRMALKGKPWQRRLWRLVGLTAIVHARRIPRAVRAPREVQPPHEATPRDLLLQELTSEIQSFERTFATTWRERPTKSLTHPFFGHLSLEQAMHVCCVHTRHHAHFLPGDGPM